MGKGRRDARTSGRASSVRELAAALDISNTQAQKWVLKGLPQSPDGTWDVFLARRWIAENRDPRGGDRSATPVKSATTPLPNLDDADAVSAWLSARGRTQNDLRRLKEALSAKQTQLELQQRRGMLIYRDAVAAQLRQHLAAIRVNIEAVPANAARAIAAALGVSGDKIGTMQACVRAEIEVAMRTLAADPIGKVHASDGSGQGD